MKVLLSIKPKYAELILDGEKKYEFRRAIFKNPSVKKVVIYASSPISKVIGEFEIDDILSLKLSELWKHTMEYSGIDKDFYDSYFSGKDIGLKKGVEIYYNSRDHDFSSTELRKRIHKVESKKKVSKEEEEQFSLSVNQEED